MDAYAEKVAELDDLMTHAQYAFAFGNLHHFNAYLARINVLSAHVLAQSAALERKEHADGTPA